MQRKASIYKSHYFNNWLLLANLLSLLISFYTCLFLAGCRQNPPEPIQDAQKRPAIYESAVNINTAGAEELEKLPRVGTELARKIIEHRDKYGAFRRAEDLILVPGMSDKKFREIRSLIKVE